MPRPPAGRLALWSLAAAVGLAVWGLGHPVQAPHAADAGRSAAGASLVVDPSPPSELFLRGEPGPGEGSWLSRVTDPDPVSPALGAVAAGGGALAALWSVPLLVGRGRPTLSRRRHVTVVRGPPAVAPVRP